MSKRIVFAGTPQFAADHLSAVLAAGFDVVGVYTQPDRATGRGQVLTPSPVKQVALDAEIPVYQPASLKDTDAQSELASLNADLMIVVAFGQILPQVVLDTPRLGCINVHASLLPRWRGAAPIERAIEAGDAESGVAIMQMDIGLDTGDVISASKVAIDNNETAASLYAKLLSAGTKTLVDTLASIFDGSATRTKQSEDDVTYAHKIEKPETFLDFSLDADVLERKVRAFYPMRCCSFSYDGKSFRIHAAKTIATQTTPPGKVLEYSQDGLVIGCGSDALCITEIQLPGKKAQPIDQVINGRPDLFTLGSQVDPL